MSKLPEIWQRLGHVAGADSGAFRRHQIASLAERAPVLTIVNLVNGMATAIVFWPIAPHHLVVAWAAILIVAPLYPLRGWLRPGSTATFQETPADWSSRASMIR